MSTTKALSVKLRKCLRELVDRRVPRSSALIRGRSSIALTAMTASCKAPNAKEATCTWVNRSKRCILMVVSNAGYLSSHRAMLLCELVRPQQHSDCSVIKFERLASSDVDGASPIATSLLFILLFSKTFASSDRQIFECFIGVVIAFV